MWKMLGNFFQKKPQGPPYLCPLEKALFKVISDTLPQPAKTIFGHQVELIGDGTRSTFELWFMPPPDNFFTKQDITGFAWPPRARFANQGDVEIVRAAFKVDETVYLMRALILEQAIHRLIIRPNPESILGRFDIQVLNAKLIRDPQTFGKTFQVKPRGPLTPGKPIEDWQWTPEVSGKVSAWMKRVRAYAMHLPMPPEGLKYFAEQVTTKLPDDYLEMLKQASGYFADAKVRGYEEEADLDLKEDDETTTWEIRDINSINEYHYEEFDFYSLFERGNWMIGTKWNDFSGELYRVAEKPFKVQKIGTTSLWAAIEKELQRPYTAKVY